MKVWIVHEEYADGDSGVAGVFLSQENAEEHARQSARDWAHLGKPLWCRNLQTGEVDPESEPDDWFVDITVEEREVQP